MWLRILYILATFFLIKCLAVPNDTVDSCTPYRCKNNGTCEQRTICRCSIGWYGPKCEEKTDSYREGQNDDSGIACNVYTCRNGGSCLDIIKCRCMPGYSGQACEITVDSTVEDGSGACVMNLCKNGGYCMANLSCWCPPGWSGPTCEEEIKSLTFATTGMQYAVVAENMSFVQAAEECSKRMGRIVDILAPTTKKDLQEVLVYSSDILLEKYQNAMNGGFWTISGKYPDPLGGRLCTVTNGNIDTVDMPCDTQLPVVCVKPASGSCYPEISKKACPTSPKDQCQYNRTSLNCKCQEGFTEVGGKCLDIDECTGYRTCISMCENTIGSYHCVCSDDMQGNGGRLCGYVLTMEQKNLSLMNIPDLVFRQTPLTPSRQSTNPKLTHSINEPKSYLNDSAIRTLQDKLEKVFKTVTKSVKMIIVKTISNDIKNASIVFDVYVKYADVTPTSLVEYWREAERQGNVFWQKESVMVPALPVCTPSVLFIGRKKFTLDSATPGEAAFSVQKCPDGRNRARVTCIIKKNSDKTTTAYYDIRTIQETACSV